MLKFVVLFFSLFNVGVMCSQDTRINNSEKANASEYYQLFDEIVGLQNTEIYNGTEIIETHRVAIGKNKYFFQDSFVPATVNFDGQPYYNVDLNYNVYDDIVIVRLENQVSTNNFKPIQEKVESFQYRDYDFINFNSLENKDLNGYYQVLGKSKESTLLKKNRLERKSKLDKKVPFYEFIPLEGDFYVKRNGMLTEITSKSDWLELYPSSGIKSKRILQK